MTYGAVFSALNPGLGLHCKSVKDHEKTRPMTRLVAICFALPSALHALSPQSRVIDTQGKYYGSS